MMKRFIQQPPRGKPFPLSAGMIAVFGLLVLLFLVRVWRLEADPPSDLSVSTDVYTDPPQYTLFAKTYVQTGEFNPYHDDRLVFFLKSTVTALAVVVFKFFGVGMWQSNLVGLLYSFGALFLFFLFIRKVGGTLAGIFYLLLISLNYNQVFYGRLPFLEHAMLFYAVLGMVLITHFRGKLGYLLAGASLATGVFFGKILGVVFLFPFTCFLVYQFFRDDKSSRIARLRDPGWLAAGFGFVALFWLFFSYLPAQSQVAGYLDTQAVELYGAPEGLQSFDDFVWKMAWFGVQTRLFPRMPVVAVLGAIFVAMMLYNAARGKSWREGFGSFTAGHVFIAAMIIAFYGSLMIWNYRPLRYSLVLIYPFCGAAGIVLSMLWREWRRHEPERTPWLFYLFCYPVVFVVLAQCGLGLSKRCGIDATFDENKYVLAILSAIVVAWLGLAVTQFKKGRVPRVQVIGKVIVALVLAAVIGRGLWAYSGWWQTPTFTARDNSRDLGMILQSGATLSGPFAAELALCNDLGTVIHMFGVAVVDTTLFERFGVTHLLIDQANETRARNDHPRIMGLAKLVCTYHVGLEKVRLFRITGRTKNPDAKQYQPSNFEMAVYLYKTGRGRQANQYALEFMQANPDNISGNLMVAMIAQESGQLDEAEILFKKAIEFSPTNYNLVASLASFYKTWFEMSGDLLYKRKGLEYYERALELAPTVKKIKRGYSELEGMNFGS